MTESTLLEGRVFYKTTVKPESGMEMMETSDDKLFTNDEQDVAAVAAAAAQAVTANKPVTRRRGRPPKSTKPEWLTTPVGNPIQLTPRQPQQQKGITNTSRSRSYRVIPKTVIKGNIIYERTETGEVIASVIKNGALKNAAMPTVTAGTAASTFVSPVHGQQPLEPRTTVTSSYPSSDLLSIPLDCPVQENNVEEILDQSIAATQSMRRVLLSLKDDLRRMGGGANMSPALKPIHIQHRVDIAFKLARAFAEYRETITSISKAESSPVNLTLSTDQSPIVPSVCAASSPAPVAAPAAVKFSSVSPATVPKLQPSASRRKSCAPVSSTKRKEAAAASVISVVSNDLWMSCDCD